MGLDTGQSDLGDEREFGVKSLAVLFITCLRWLHLFGWGWVIHIKKRQSNFLNNIHF